MSKEITIARKSDGRKIGSLADSDFIPSVNDVIMFTLTDGSESFATVLGRFIEYDSDGNIVLIEIEIDG